MPRSKKRKQHMNVMASKRWKAESVITQVPEKVYPVFLTYLLILIIV